MIPSSIGAVEEIPKRRVNGRPGGDPDGAVLLEGRRYEASRWRRRSRTCRVRRAMPQERDRGSTRGGGAGTHSPGPPQPAPLHGHDARRRGARDHAVPTGKGAGELLRRLRPGGDLGWIGVCARPARPDVHPAPRPRRPLRPRGHARPLLHQLHGTRRRCHGRQGRQHALRRPGPRLCRDGLDAARHGARSERDGARVQASPRTPDRDDLLRRGLDCQRPVARGDELRRHPPAAGRVRAREQRLRLLDTERARVRGRSRSSARRPMASQA